MLTGQSSASRNIFYYCINPVDKHQRYAHAAGRPLASASISKATWLVQSQTIRDSFWGNPSVGGLYYILPLFDVLLK